MDRLRATPSGGASAVNPNGAGGSEGANKIEFDLNFTRTGEHIIWYRASSDGGNDDSLWLHVDGARPPDRAAANLASMSGFNAQLEFVWRTNPQEGGGQMTFDIPTAGTHAIIRFEQVADSMVARMAIPRKRPREFPCPAIPARHDSGA